MLLHQSQCGRTCGAGCLRLLEDGPDLPVLWLAVGVTVEACRASSDTCSGAAAGHSMSMHTHCANLRSTFKPAALVVPKQPESVISQRWRLIGHLGLRGERVAQHPPLLPRVHGGVVFRGGA